MSVMMQTIISAELSNEGKSVKLLLAEDAKG